MVEMTRVLVAYDISDDVKRARVAEWLLAKGFSRIQRSLYVARGGVALARDVKRFVERVIDPETDVVHILVLSDIEWSKRIVVGTSDADRDAIHLA